MRSILLDWGHLSRGDISVVVECVRNPAATALTLRGSAHARFWQELVTIGWAEQLYSPFDPYKHDPEPLAYRLLAGGETALSHFLVRHDLLNMGECTPVVDRDAYFERKRIAEASVRVPPPRKARTFIDLCCTPRGLILAFCLGWAAARAFPG